MSKLSITIPLNRNGYEPFIDVLKGLAILGVLLNHALPYYVKHPLGFDFWGGMAVPLFFVIQSFQYFKKGFITAPNIKYRKIIRRIIYPFIGVQSLIILIKSIDSGLIVSLQECIMRGGYGCGEYYPWIYLQFVILLPLTHHLVRFLDHFPTSFIWKFGCFALLAELLELGASLLFFSELTWKFLFIRYFFCVWGGYIGVCTAYGLTRLH